VIYSDYPKLTNARNIGIRHAKGDLILFCDDDIIPSSKMIEVHVKNHNIDAVGGVSCRVIEEDLHH
jgi:glycosyltransferase involved in cell wall biosynthesis